MRFIDLGTQTQLPCEGTEREFAFYDTIVDGFLSLDHDQVWSSWDDFRESARCDKVVSRPDFMERCRELCPAWVFEKSKKEGDE